jgi:hypothetical protein
MTTRAQRKRPAALAALGLLDWRDRKAKEDASNRTAKEKSDHEKMQRYKNMIAAMAEEADKPHTASQVPCKMITTAFRGDGGVGILYSTTLPSRKTQTHRRKLS